MQADVFILGHDAAGLEPVRHVDVLCQIGRRRLQPDAQFLLFAIGGEGDAVHRADIDAGIALDAELAGERRSGRRN